MKKIEVKHNLGNKLCGGQGKKKLYVHCNTYMIICREGLAFAGHCMQSGTRKV